MECNLTPNLFHFQPLKHYEEEQVYKPDFVAALKEVSERVDY